ncbi:unnamed protein product [Macrosiphum euphorbiae]|uniref:Uncharacterized protein n=1 Tax=Macrosiphum euphorbiae TaxID=13131 RepID=A0AAV0Y4N1_9HEMI|nr:unnamed protein product [Macrosiphum euphorbiae]
MNTTDKYYGNIATIVGLGLKNIAERTHEAITGSNSAIYPQCGCVESEQKDNDAQGPDANTNAEPSHITSESRNNIDSVGQLRSDNQYVGNSDKIISTSGNMVETPTSS